MYLRLVSILVLISLCACQSTPKATEKNINGNEADPKLTKPEVHKIWVPVMIMEGGRKMIGGHWEYVIDKDSSWAN